MVLYQRYIKVYRGIPLEETRAWLIPIHFNPSIGRLSFKGNGSGPQLIQKI